MLGRASSRRTRRLAAALLTLTLLFTAAMMAGAVGAAPARADIVRNTEMWVLNELHMQEAWTLAPTQGRGVKVAVIDSGVDGQVSDLTGSVTQGPDFTGVHPLTPASDLEWGVHGTWMASLIVGHGHDGGGSGIIGTAPGARVLSIRVITDAKDPAYALYQKESGRRGQQQLARAINYAVSKQVGVISMSLGYQQPSRPVRAALQNAYKNNVVVVASAGNSGDQRGASGRGHAPYSYPADYPGVLAVGAVNSAGQPASFSSQNISVQVAAPGYKVPAQGRDGGYWLVSGTSPACALTAGVVALIKSKYPQLTDAQVISAITTSTSPKPDAGYNDQVGFGVVDADAALIAAGKLATAVPPSADTAAATHFGGGVAAVPALPVAPRGAMSLVLFCLLGAACLGLVALSTSRIFAERDRSWPSQSESAAESTSAAAAGRHAVPRGGQHDQAQRS